MQLWTCAESSRVDSTVPPRTFLSGHLPRKIRQGPVKEVRVHARLRFFPPSLDPVLDRGKRNENPVGAYERHIDPAQHHVGKENTQRIESKHINLRTRIKRLMRRTICFSKTTTMHDLVLSLFINRYEFGRLL